MIKDLLLETHHRERYLLLRTVIPTDTMTAVMAIVEDEDGEVLTLQLYNQGDDLSGAQDIRQGTVIVVKEPYVKVMADGNYSIRVDHLSDVKFIWNLMIWSLYVGEKGLSRLMHRLRFGRKREQVFLSNRLSICYRLVKSETQNYLEATLIIITGIQRLWRAFLLMTWKLQ